MLRSKMISVFVLASLIVQPLAHALDEKDKERCEYFLNPEIRKIFVQALEEAEQRIANEETANKAICGNRDADCLRTESVKSSEKILKGLTGKISNYLSEKVEVIKGKNIRTVSGPKRDFWLTLWLVYAYQTFGMAAYEYNKGRFNISDIHFDVLPTTFVKLWMQKEIQARKTSGLKDEVLNDKEILEMKSGMKGFIRGVVKAYAGNQNFFKEVGNRLKGFFDFLPWGAATMVAFRMGEASIRSDYQMSMADVETDVLLTLIFDGYLAIRWSMFDAPMVRVFDSLKQCSSETCVQKYGRLFAEVGIKSAIMSGDSILFFYLRNDWLPALVQSGVWGSIMALFGG